MKKAPDAHNNAIKVFCRMRPLNSLEKSTGGNCCIEHTDKAINLKVHSHPIFPLVLKLQQIYKVIKNPIS